ncbi:AAA family ATPase [Longispora sp. NPDC051575]|uniref:AAA family ATPase n=1 Tax=Longispora sp. NPDC051575 TaxID=3154943 RepID=UPI0034471034
MARDIVLVNGLPGAGKSTLAALLAVELGALALSKDRLKEALADAVAPAPTTAVTGPTLGAVAMGAVWALAAHHPGTVLIDSWWFRPRDLEHAREGLATTGAMSALEIWCEVPTETARIRCATRERHPIHQDGHRLATDWPRWAAEAAPLALTPVIRVDTSGLVDVAAVARTVRHGLGGSGAR